MALREFRFFEYISKKQKAISIFFIVFYTVGVIGMVFPYTFSLFLKLIPFALILSFVAVGIFHSKKIEWNTIICFVLIYIIAFTIEAIGVNTGKIFGYYTYGEGLGLKLFQTPLIIGINWIFLVYTSSSVVDKFKLSSFFKILFASVAMLIYDIVLEQIASKLDMWHWKDNFIPLQNYLAWFAIAVFFHSLIRIMKVRTENKLALLILSCQFLFFLLLYIFLIK